MKILEKILSVTNQKLHLFNSSSQYQLSQRASLADILRPLINSRTPEQNRAIYGTTVDQYTLVDQVGQADWYVLPFNWNYYQKARTLKLAARFIRLARQAGKPVITWIHGDFGACVPDPAVWIFGAAGHQSCAGIQRFGIPVFIRDPLREQGFPDIQPRLKEAKPLIGFCGYARSSLINAATFVLTTLTRNTASTLGLTGAESQDLYPPVLLRQRILDRLRSSPLVGTNFIQNAQYQAGARTVKARDAARKRFFENIRSTNYTLCVRGSGNFSARLYETLAMGRIPIFVDTDCLLPYSSDPRWQQCCVYIRQEQIDQVAEIVAAYHNRLSSEEFLAIQHQARRFWEERLCLEGFFNHFPKHFGVEGGTT